MTLASELQAIEPLVQSSPIHGFEYVRGYGVFGAPFDSGHVLALRVFPENDFAPYATVWHRTPDGAWSIFVDGPRPDIACPRYYGAAASVVQSAQISLTWTSPSALRIEIDSPRLVWEIALAPSPTLRLMNLVNPRIPERLRRAPITLRAMERMAQYVLGLGRVTLYGIAPNGQLALLLPERMFDLNSARAELEGVDLGGPARGVVNPAIGEIKLPARPVFAVGRAYFELRDPVEYARTVRELAERRESRPTDGVAALS